MSADQPTTAASYDDEIKRPKDAKATPATDAGEWLITRPCCGASGLLVRPNNAVHIPHETGCRHG